MSDAKETQTSEGAERIDPPGVISSEEPEAIQGSKLSTNIANNWYDQGPQTSTEPGPFGRKLSNDEVRDKADKLLSRRSSLAAKFAHVSSPTIDRGSPPPEPILASSQFPPIPFNARNPVSDSWGLGVRNKHRSTTPLPLNELEVNSNRFRCENCETLNPPERNRCQECRNAIRFFEGMSVPRDKEEMHMWKKHCGILPEEYFTGELEREAGLDNWEDEEQSGGSVNPRPQPTADGSDSEPTGEA